MPFADWIAANARRTPERIALRFGPQQISWRALAGHCDRIAAALAAAGVARGDCVSWLGLNSPSMLAMLFACARQGLVFMPLNWRLAPPEHHAVLADVAPALLCADAGFATTLANPTQVARRVALGAAPAGWARWDDFLAGVERPVAPPPRASSTASAAGTDPAAPLLLCFTSGSTGRPKGVLLSADALAANADASVDMHALRADDRVLTTLPLFHVGGLNILTTPALRCGCTVTLHERFDADATFDAIERERITLTVLVPAQLEAMVQHPRWPRADLSSLRMITSGSTQVPLRLIRAVHTRGVPLVQVWGATETAPIAAALHAGDAMRKPGSSGRAARGCELRVVDFQGRPVAPGESGEVLVRGRMVMSDYWRDPAATGIALAGGWYHSGDSGHFDREGFLYIDGRLKDMIISGGENISPAEVEAVLLDSPEIAEAAVVGRPDARWGEAVVAVIAPAPGARPSRESVLALFEGRLARFKHPKEVHLVDALPRTALGKVRKEAVRELVAGSTALAPAPSPTPSPAPSPTLSATPREERAA